MKYDFIEIGTSDFDTIVQNSMPDVTGLCIEPVKFYLDRLSTLPRPNVKFINAAVSFDDVEGDIQVYYVPEEVIRAHNLPEWMRGCNSVGNYHFQHKAYGIENLVKIEKVKQIPIGKLWNDYDIESVHQLKIDTEGGDLKILDNLLRLMESLPWARCPYTITFESNSLVQKDEVIKTVYKFINECYTVVSMNLDHNTTLVKKML